MKNARIGLYGLESCLILREDEGLQYSLSDVIELEGI